MAPGLEQALEEHRDLKLRLQRLIDVKLEYFAPSRDLLRALSGHTSPDHPLSPFSEQTRDIRDEDIRFFARALEGSRSPVRVLRLGGLAAVAGAQLLAQSALSGSAEEQSQLVAEYAGNPLALKIVAETTSDQPLMKPSDGCSARATHE